MRDAFAAGGAQRYDALRRMPRAIADGIPRPGDERFATLAGRRATLEHALARAAEAQPGLTVLRGAEAAALTTRPGRDAPHVTGVRTTAGQALAADLVVDAMGRGSRLPRLLAAAGAEPAAEEAEDFGFIYYTRFFRGSTPPAPRAPLLTPIGSFSILAVPSDVGTWSLTIYVAAGDRPLKRLRDPETWTALIRACPRHAHWLEGDPITGVLAMAGVVNRRREAAPAATGIASLGDAWACTNPSVGRGIALGLMHAALLRDVAREHLGDPAGFGAAWREATDRELTPWYRSTVAGDQARYAEMQAFRAGRAPDPPRDQAGVLRAALMTAMARDPDVFRAGLEIANCLTLPQDVFARQGLAARVLALAAGADGSSPPGPDRDEVLRLVAGAAVARRPERAAA